MTVSPDTYLQLYQLIYNRIAEVAYPDATETLQRKQIEAATILIKVGGSDSKPKRVDASKHHLCSSFGYFYNLRTQARKGNDVSIDPMKLCKAIEFVNKVKDEEKYYGVEWENQATLLLEKFERQLGLKKIGMELKYEEIEQLFLQVVTSHQNVFESKKIKELIAEYFESIRDRRFLDAWNRLSPNLQKNSIWNGDFSLYEAATSLVISLNTLIHVDRFSYEYGSVTCHTRCYGTASLFNLEDLLGLLMQSASRRILVEIRREFKKKAILIESSGNFSWPISSKNIAKLNLKQQSEFFDQATLLLSFLDLADQKGKEYFARISKTQIFNNDEVRKEQFFNHEYKFQCKLFGSKWLIDTVEIRNSY